jgi:DNA-binding CsgD family transcriptional regulator
VVGHAGVRITELFGARTGDLRNLLIRPGAGLGGYVFTHGRPAAVDNYLAASGITHDYDGPVRSEGLWSVAAAPVAVAERPRALLYAATRQQEPLGNRAKDLLVSAGQRLSAEMGSRDELDRRFGMLQEAAAVGGAAWSAAELEDLRAAYAEIREVAALLPDDGLRRKLANAYERLAALRSAGLEKPGPRLSAREIDVLAEVAIGCTNTQTAARLAVRPETVKAYLRSAMRKLDAHSRHEAVVNARRFGLLP